MKIFLKGGLGVDREETMNRCCRECEYYDDSTGIKRTAKSGDCHMPDSPRFTPEADFVCDKFYPNTSIYEQRNGVWQYLKEKGVGDEV